ncbi:hypothetical protein [Nocardioides sp.]|uniref:hypothetical protein n=1 Tax=Nocardioides sp. TaxID=35761 RepID=UPI00356B6044
MSWLGLLLVGVGIADLAYSVRPTKVVPEVVGAFAAVLLGLFAGLTAGADIVALLLVAVAVVAWGQTVSRGFGGGSPWVPLVVLGSAMTAAVAFSGLAGAPNGPLRSWLDGLALPLLAGMAPDRFLLLLGAVLVQLSTGNVLVRLVLAVTGTVNPTRSGGEGGPETRLKGGRLLGPMERVLILGLGLAGHVTAASLVVAAKGLLRFPELSSRREQEQIHQLTEYFLVGSFVSWLVALGALALLVT